MLPLAHQRHGRLPDADRVERQQSTQSGRRSNGKGAIARNIPLECASLERARHMRHSAQQLAKLTRPRLHAPIARERLFAAIDLLRASPAIWIQGPPGAGKTTLAASYLQEAAAPHLWYQVDAGDSDPGTFFYYLRQAASALSPRRKTLPLLTSEYLPDVAGFTRRFFRDLFGRLPPGAILVLDNYHELCPESPLHALLALAIEEIPQAANLMVMSRTAPPAALARAALCGQIGFLGWDDLRLTREESQLIVGSGTRVDSDTARSLFEQCDGWIAGVMLIAEQLRQHRTSADAPIPEPREAAFDYIASQVFDPQPHGIRHVLMSIAFLPRVTAAVAECVSGDPDAGKTLERIYRRRLFINRQAGEPPSYELHALFRAFLENRALLQLGPNRVRDAKLAAALHLNETGFAEEALGLYVETCEWERAADLVVHVAPGLIASGRWQTLTAWIAQLPSGTARGRPWIGYWFGRARTQSDPAAGAELLREVYGLFDASGDELGQLLCGVAILEALHHRFEDFRAMDPWLTRVGNLLERGVHPPAAEDEIRANAAVMMASTFRSPRRDVLEHCVQRVQDLLSRPLDADLRLWVATHLQSYAHLAMDQEAERMASQLGHDLLGCLQITPRTNSDYLGAIAYTHYVYGRYDEALPAIRGAEDIDQTNGLEEKWVNHALQRGLCERRAGLLDAAEATIARLEPLRDRMGTHQAAMLWFLQGAVAFDRGRRAEGMREMVKSFHVFDRAGQFNATVLAGLLGGNAAIPCGEWETARQLLDRVEATITGSVADNFIGVLKLNRAWLSHKLSDQASTDSLLGESLRCAGDLRARPRYRWHVNALAEMLPVAIQRGIELDTAFALARELDVVPASPFAAEAWPWQVKIYTLGRFEILIDGKPAVFERKVPKKPLALLQAIIALGSCAVREERLMDALWPDEDGDAAHRVFNTTLYRLRKLLRHSGLVAQSGGRLTLDAGRCWVDAIVFERALQEGMPSGHAETALALYRGAFLQTEAGGPWVASTRERLRGKFVQAVRSLGQEAEQGGRLDEAIAWYARGLEADHLVEALYQGLMRCHARMAHSADVTNVYRRMRSALSLSLGVPPSALSERLYRQSLITAAQQPGNA